MVKNHLKRIATPKTWNILRKSNVFITRPNPGAHSYNHATSLNTTFKELAGLADTRKEVKRMLHEQEVLVDGKKRHDERHNVGFMDVITLPKTKQALRISFTKKGKLTTFDVPQNEAELKLARITGKQTLKGGVTQLALHDGRTLRVKKDTYKVGDTLVIKLPTQEIKEHHELKIGASVMVYEGKYTGYEGTIENISEDGINVKTTEGTIHTKKSYIFVTGDKKPAIKCSP